MKSRAQRYRYVRHVVSGTRPSPWSPLSLGSSLAAWYKADAGCYTDAACLFTAASNMDLRRASSASLQVGDIDFSFVLFVKHATLSSWNTLLRKGFGWEAGGEFSIFSDGSGAVTWRVRKADDSTNVDVTSTDVCGTSAFDMIEVYHDATNNLIGVRVNNGTSVTAAVPAGVFTGANNLSIGDSDSGGTSNRSIARVGFWKRLLTAGERTSLYNAGAGKFYADLTTAEKVSLVEYWNLCESSSTRVGSHAGLNLTPTNGPTVAAGPGEGACVDNSPVKRWESQYGSNHATQATITKQPIWTANSQNGKPCVVFDGTNHEIDPSAIDYSASAIGVVLNLTDPTGYKAVITTVKHAVYGNLSTAGKWGGFFGAEVSSGVALSSTYKSIIQNVRAFNDIDLYTNGSKVTATNGSGFDGRATHISPTAAGQAHIGGIAELLVTDRALSNAECSSMAAYFASAGRWSL